MTIGVKYALMLTTQSYEVSTVVEPVLYTFPNSHMVKARFSHTIAILVKEKNRLNLEESDNFQLKWNNC